MFENRFYLFCLLLLVLTISDALEVRMLYLSSFFYFPEYLFMSEETLTFEAFLVFFTLVSVLLDSKMLFPFEHFSMV